MNISIQGEYESIFSNYQNLRMYKGKGQVTAMPRNVHQLLNVKLVIHIEAEDEIADKIYENIVSGKESFTLGRNEDLVRVDDIKFIKDTKLEKRKRLKYNAYVVKGQNNSRAEGINYRINTTYKIDKNGLRKWDKVDVKYLEKNEWIQNCIKDEDGDIILFYKGEN